MDAQEMHDYEMSKRKALSEVSRERLEALLQAKEKKSPRRNIFIGAMIQFQWLCVTIPG